ncbi:SIMPL domain-containing protein [Pasteurellaceae bacterium 22721_9_1]
MKYKALWLSLLALPCFALATDTVKGDEPKNTVRFSVEVEKNVPFDVLQVKLFVQEENADLKALHKTVSDKVAQVLAKIKAQSAVEIKSNNRYTNVNYNEKGRKNGWLERAEFVLESKDFYALSQLIEEVSDVLSIENIDSILSAEALGKLEDDLSKEALAKFRHKADLIKQSLQAKEYHILSLDMPSLNEPNYDMRYNRAMPYAAVSMSSEKMAEPVRLEGGKASVKARVDAQIELIEN